MNERINIVNREKMFMNWMSKNCNGIEGLSKNDSDVILDYLNDMKLGVNVSKGSKKGGRSYSRLLSIAHRMIVISRLINQQFSKDIILLTRDEAHYFFEGLKTGIIKQPNGEPYGLNTIESYGSVFIAFWNWRIKKERSKGNTIDNIVEYLSSSSIGDNNVFCYFTKEQLNKVINKFKFNEIALLNFLFDSGLRSPLELINIKVSDITFEREVMLNVRISKTFPRRFNLTFSGQIIKEYIIKSKLKPEDPLFNLKEKDIREINKKLQTVFSKEFGNNNLGGKPYNKMVLYDFRHSSCCYYRGLNINLDKLLYRFGWTNIRKANYYSRFIGHNGVVTKDEIHQEQNILLNTIEKQQKQIDSLLDLLKREKEAKR